MNQQEHKQELVFFVSRICCVYQKYMKIVRPKIFKNVKDKGEDLEDVKYRLISLKKDLWNAHMISISWVCPGEDEKHKEDILC